MIPEAAVEAAQKVWSGLEGEAWEVARAALEAAAPHIVAAQAKAKSPKHQCEPWQIQVNGSGTFRYCAACGEPQP